FCRESRKEQQMRHLQISLAVLLALAMTSAAKLTTASAYAAETQNQASALERGYRTGYSDGYTSGTKDIADQVARDYQNKEDYQRADRSYNQAWGSLEDYRDGYQQGFESGYAAGYDRRPFDSTIPAGIEKRVVTGTGTSIPNPIDNNSSDTPINETSNTSVQVPVNNAPLYIPRDVILLIEMQSRLSTDVSQRGDRFQARVM